MLLPLQAHLRNGHARRLQLPASPYPTYNPFQPAHDHHHPHHQKQLDYFDQRAEADVLAAQQPLLERRFVSKLRAAGWGTLPVVIHLVEASQDAGTLARVVCKRARQLGAALVVIGRHEHSRLREFFLGSAGESVARELKHDSVEVRLVREADLASAGGSSSGADGGGGGAEAS